MWRGCTEVEVVEVEVEVGREAGREAGREMVRGIAISISAREVRAAAPHLRSRDRTRIAAHPAGAAGQLPLTPKPDPNPQTLT